MGTLLYSPDAQPITIDDRLLQYLQVVVSTKLRRGESFTVTWTDEEAGHARTTLWIQPSIPMRFEYTAIASAPLSGGYLRQLADQAAMSSGLLLNAATWQQNEDAHRCSCSPRPDAPPHRSAAPPSWGGIFRGRTVPPHLPPRHCAAAPPHRGAFARANRNGPRHHPRTKRRPAAKQGGVSAPGSGGTQLVGIEPRVTSAVRC